MSTRASLENLLEDCGRTPQDRPNIERQGIDGRVMPLMLVGWLFADILHSFFFMSVEEVGTAQRYFVGFFFSLPLTSS